MGGLPIYVNPKNMRVPAGPYSQMSSSGGLLFIAGQAGVNRSGEVMADIYLQTAQTFENIRLALESQNLGLRNLLYLTIYLVSSDLVSLFEAEMRRLEPQLFPHGCPPSTLLIVNGLARPQLLIEIAAVAHV